MIITTSHDNKPTDSVSSFVLKTNHAHKFFFLFFFRNAMVSVYSLRPVYTFLYTIINGNVIASFVQKKKSFEILWSTKIFFVYVRNLELPLPLIRSRTHLTWPLPSPFVRTYYVDDPFSV